MIHLPAYRIPFPSDTNIYPSLRIDFIHAPASASALPSLTTYMHSRLFNASNMTFFSLRLYLSSFPHTDLRIYAFTHLRLFSFSFFFFRRTFSIGIGIITTTITTRIAQRRDDETRHPHICIYISSLPATTSSFHRSIDIRTYQHYTYILYITGIYVHTYIYTIYILSYQ